MDTTIEDKMVFDLEEDIYSLKDKLKRVERDRYLITGTYNSLYREHEDFKVEKKKYYDNWGYAIVEIIHLEYQIKKLQMP